MQIGSYVGSLVSRWTHILKGEQKQLLAAGAGAGLAAAFAAPLASSLIVIESIERFDAPKTAITTLLAGVVAGAVASMVFPVNPYHLIEVTEPVFRLLCPDEVFLDIGGDCLRMREVLLLHHECFQACVCQSQFSGVCQDVLSGAGGLHHFADAGQSDWRRGAVSAGPGTEWQYADYVGDGRHVAAFCLFSFLCLFRIAGRQFHSDAGYGRLLGQIVGLVGVRYGVIGQENVSYIMLVSMSAFLVAVVRTPLTAIVLITEITGHFEVFYPSVVVGGLTYYFYGTSANEAFQRLPL